MSWSTIPGNDRELTNHQSWRQEAMKLIGSVGRIGAGKDTVINYLHRQWQLPTYSLGDQVRRKAVEMGCEIDRDTLQDVARQEIKTNGELVFIRRLVDQLCQDEPEAAGITGLRKPLEIRFLKKCFGDNFFLVHVQVTSREIRFHRLRERGEPRDPQTFAEFKVQDQHEEQLFHISQAIQMADLTLNNDCCAEDLYRQIEASEIKRFLQACYRS